MPVLLLILFTVLLHLISPVSQTPFDWDIYGMEFLRYIFDRGRMYDSWERLIARRDPNGQYTDKRGRVRASERNHVSAQEPCAFDDHGPEARQLSSSTAGRRSPSYVKEPSTSASIQYPGRLVLPPP